jgi:uncharacterized protein
MPFKVPCRENTRLAGLVERIQADLELNTLWRCANVTAIDRSGISDHGPVHIQIVANIALRLMRMLVAAEVKPSIATNYEMTNDDAEVVVVLAAALHDLGMAVHRENHEQFSVALAAPRLPALLAGVYEPEPATIITAEVLHAIYAHQSETRCLTIEAGVSKVADALDMTKGRSRIPFEAGRVNIHSLSAASIEKVRLGKGQEKPIRIEIDMSNSAGIFQVDELLKYKLRSSGIDKYIEVAALVRGETEKQLVRLFNL